MSAPADPDAPHEEPNVSYIPALDGIRAFAVLAVMAYHDAIPFLPAGFLGVDTFFVLSGFLITTLLLGEWRRRATIRLGAFWARRARRLLPGLLLVLLFVACYAAFVVPRGTYPDLRLDALSTLFYVANWHFILIGSNYFVQSGPVSLLTHTWSLSIEEQFYLVWPLVVLAVLKLGGRKADRQGTAGGHLIRRLRLLLVICVGGALASAAEMAFLYHRGASATRLYYGTDTHAQCLLVGAGLAATLALIAEHRRARGTVPVFRRPPGGDAAWAAQRTWVRVLLSTAGGVGAVATAVLWWRVSYTGSFLWNGGFLVAALSTAAVLACVVCVQRSWLALALSISPLRYLGRISYGMYLWHFPLFQWIDGQRTGLTGYPLFGVRCVATVAVATASFYLVERPIRQGDFFRQWRAWAATPVAVAVVVVALVAATTAPAVAQVAPSKPSSSRSSSSLYKGPRVKVLLIGDSTALTLGLGLSEVVKTYDVTENDQAILGCGVTVGAEFNTKGTDEPVAQPCSSVPAPAGTPLRATTPPGFDQAPRPDAERWTVWYKHWVDTYDPNVVMLLAGRWEVVNRTYDGKWTNILDPTFAAYVKRQLEYTVKLASAKGARVVLLTAPCYDTGEQPNGQPWPTSSPQRLAVYNRLVKEVAAEHPSSVSVLDFNSMACPGGQFEEFMGGVQVRTSDGIHFTITGGKYLAPKIWPTIVKVGREQMAAKSKGSGSGQAPAAPSS